MSNAATPGPARGAVRARAARLAIDGADQVTPNGWLVKGDGGTHPREKIVVAAAERFVVIVDSSKQVEAIAPPVPLKLGEVDRRWDPVGGSPAMPGSRRRLPARSGLLEVDGRPLGRQVRDPGCDLLRPGGWRGDDNQFGHPGFGQ